jgi:hypothetical protein
MIHPNSQLLIDTLEKATLFENRYERLKWVNIDSKNHGKRGCFSLVFKAFDRVDAREVALKFFDIHPALMLDEYRRGAFRREHALLQSLIGKERYLQVASSFNKFDLNVNAGGVELTIPCEYFAVEWLDVEIDEYFATQEVAAIARLDAGQKRRAPGSVA